MIQKSFIEVDGHPVARVSFVLPNGTWAGSISLVGDFNGWNTLSHRLEHTNEGKWMITVDLKMNRSYQFRYLCDGEWINDGQADAYVHNRHGSDNFVVITDPEFTPQHWRKKVESVMDCAEA